MQKKKKSKLPKDCDLKEGLFFCAYIVILTNPFCSFRFLRFYFTYQNFALHLFSWLLFRGQCDSISQQRCFCCVAVFSFEKHSSGVSFFFTTTKTNVVLSSLILRLCHSIRRCFCRRLRYLRCWIQSSTGGFFFFF